jgi:hypothetical protein
VLYAAPILDAAPHALDAVALFVGLLVVGDGFDAGLGRRDDSLGALSGEPSAQVIGVISAVGDEAPDRSVTVEKACRDGDVVDVSGRQDEDARAAFAIGERVELARPPAARGAERLLEGPPFPPAADRCALMCVLSIAARP